MPHISTSYANLADLPRMVLPYVTLCAAASVIAICSAVAIFTPGVYWYAISSLIVFVAGLSFMWVAWHIWSWSRARVYAHAGFGSEPTRVAFLRQKKFMFFAKIPRMNLGSELPKLHLTLFDQNSGILESYECRRLDFGFMSPLLFAKFQTPCTNSVIEIILVGEVSKSAQFWISEN